jgi:hypothetical protein
MVDSLMYTLRESMRLDYVATVVLLRYKIWPSSEVSHSIMAEYFYRSFLAELVLITLAAGIQVLHFLAKLYAESHTLTTLTGHVKKEHAIPVRERVPI